MKKYLVIPLFLFLAGCSYFSVNATNCDQLILNDPNTQNIPAECRDYNEKEADKATYPPGQKPIEINKEFEIGK